MIRARKRELGLFVAMIAAVAVVAAVLYWDERRDQAIALDDFAREQVDVARGAARVPAAERVALESAGETVIIDADSARAMKRANGENVISSELDAALASHAQTIRLSRAAASALGLGERMAVAGIVRGTDGHSVIVVASARHVRDRGFHAQDRVVFGVVIAALLVGAFGGIALRVQRREHMLERELIAKARDQEREERLARADKLATMGALTTGIAHEIATPLGVIFARTESLSNEDPRSVRVKQTILEQIEKIRGIVQSFLAIARGQTPEASRIGAREALDSAARMVEHRFETAGVELVVEVDDAAPAIFGEPRLLEQAIVNLLLNACEASERGGHVWLRAKRSNADGDRVVVSVEDEGEGIAPDAAARATEAFFTTKPAGTGLGLAIANEIAKHHQGRFVIEALSPHGTRAALELPAKAKSSAAEQAA